MERLKYLMSLMAACPIGTPAEDCPFKEYHNAPLSYLIEKGHEMEFRKSMGMIDHHKTCLQKRNQMLKAG